MSKFKNNCKNLPLLERLAKKILDGFHISTIQRAEAFPAGFRYVVDIRGVYYLDDLARSRL